MQIGKHRTIFVLMWCFIFTALCLVYAGFYFPDPFYFGPQHALGLRLLLIATKVAGAAVILGWIIAGFLFSRLEMNKTGLILALSSLLFSVLIGVSALAVWDSLRHRSSGDFHSYLHLPPPEDGFPPGGGKKILFLGGSTTAWPDSSGKHWPELVQQRLEEAGFKTRIFNAAREWYTTQHSLYNFISNLRAEKPDIIVVSHAINDLLHNADFSYLSQGTFRQDYGHFWGPLGNLVRRQGLLRNIFTKLMAGWYHNPRQLVDSRFPGREAFERNLRTLIEIGQLDGARLVLATQPTILKEGIAPNPHFHMVNFEAVGPGKRWSVSTAVKGMRIYNESVRTLSQAMSVSLVDAESVIPKTSDYFSDEVHYLDPAFPLLADIYARELEAVLEGGEQLAKRP